MLLQDIQREKNDAKEFGIKQKLLQAVSSFVRGPVQANLKATYGWAAGFVGAAGFIGVSALANYIGFSAQRKGLVNIYRDELALLLNKDRDAIGIDDLKAYVAKVDPARDPIANDYAIVKSNEHATQKKSLCKNVAISALVIGFAAVAPSLAVGMMGFAIAGAIAIATDIVAESKLERWQISQRGTGASFTRQIQNEMSKGRVGPARLFEYAVQAQPELAYAVRTHLGEEYAGLSFDKKQMVMQKLGLAGTMTSIADDLNRGNIRVSELPFLLAGVNSPSTSAQRYAATTMASATRQADTTPVATASVPQHVIHSVELDKTLASEQALAHAI